MFILTYTRACVCVCCVCAARLRPAVGIIIISGPTSMFVTLAIFQDARVVLKVFDRSLLCTSTPTAIARCYNSYAPERSIHQSTYLHIPCHSTPGTRSGRTIFGAILDSVVCARLSQTMSCLFCTPPWVYIRCTQALTVNALGGDDRELWMRAIADKVQQLKDALVVLPKRKGTR